MALAVRRSILKNYFPVGCCLFVLVCTLIPRPWHSTHGGRVARSYPRPTSDACSRFIAHRRTRSRFTAHQAMRRFTPLGPQRGQRPAHSAWSRLDLRSARFARSRRSSDIIFFLGTVHFGPRTFAGGLHVNSSGPLHCSTTRCRTTYGIPRILFFRRRPRLPRMSMAKKGRTIRSFS